MNTIKKWLFRIKIIITILVVISFSISIFQNSKPTTISFMLMKFEFPLSTLLIGAFIAGMLAIISIVGWFSSGYERIGKKEKEEREEKNQNQENPVDVPNNPTA